MDPERPATPRKPAAGSGRSKNRQDLIGRQLRRIYQDLVNEPLPDSFKDLLQQIENEKSDQSDESGRS